MLSLAMIASLIGSAIAAPILPDLGIIPTGQGIPLLGGGGGGPLAPVQGLTQGGGAGLPVPGLGGPAGPAAGHGGPLAPITGLAGPLTGGGASGLLAPLGGGGGLLAPAGGLTPLGGLTGPLKPVTSLLAPLSPIIGPALDLLVPTTLLCANVEGDFLGHLYVVGCACVGIKDGQLWLGSQIGVIGDDLLADVEAWVVSQVHLFGEEQVCHPHTLPVCPRPPPTFHHHSSQAPSAMSTMGPSSSYAGSSASASAIASPSSLASASASASASTGSSGGDDNLFFGPSRLLLQSIKSSDAPGPTDGGSIQPGPTPSPFQNAGLASSAPTIAGPSDSDGQVNAFSAPAPAAQGAASSVAPIMKIEEVTWTSTSTVTIPVTAFIEILYETTTLTETQISTQTQYETRFSTITSTVSQVSTVTAACEAIGGQPASASRGPSVPASSSTPSASQINISSATATSSAVPSSSSFSAAPSASASPSFRPPTPPVIMCPQGQVIKQTVCCRADQIEVDGECKCTTGFTDLLNVCVEVCLGQLIGGECIDTELGVDGLGGMGRGVLGGLLRW